MRQETVWGILKHVAWFVLTLLLLSFIIRDDVHYSEVINASKSNEVQQVPSPFCGGGVFLGLSKNYYNTVEEWCVFKQDLVVRTTSGSSVKEQVVANNFVVAFEPVLCGEGVLLGSAQHRMHEHTQASCDPDCQKGEGTKLCAIGGDLFWITYKNQDRLESMTRVQIDWEASQRTARGFQRPIELIMPK